MSAKAKAIKTLYNARRITIEGVKRAVKDGIINATDYASITGEEFA